MPEQSVAERLRANFEKAQARRTKALQFPPIEGLYIVFRPIIDFAEVEAALESVSDALPKSQMAIENAIRLMIVSSVDSYAMVDGERREIGLKLGVQLYDMIFPAENGEIRPQTDGEAVTRMFTTETGELDSLSILTFAQGLDVARKLSRMMVEAEPGKF
jgi:hypothetical protein